MDPHSTDELIGMIEALDRPSAPLLNLFFPDEQTFDTETVYLDQVDAARRLAPFVSPNVAGKPQRQRGFQTRDFRPPYIKPKHALEPGKQLKRRAGERLTGEMTPMARLEAALVENLQLQDDQITRREEWMASQLLRTGSMTLSGEDYPEMTVDLGRNAAHTITLSGGARWGESGVSPYKTIRTWAATVHKNSGAHPGRVVLDPLAADLLLEDEAFTKILDNRRQMGGEAQLAGVTTGGEGEEIKYIGSVGEFDYYQYSNFYTDEDGAVLNMMPDYTVVLGNPKLAAGVRTYGAILDTSTLVPATRFPKEWDEQDPSVRFVMTQSAPLPLLGRPDATFCATVR